MYPRLFTCQSGVSAQSKEDDSKGQSKEGEEEEEEEDNADFLAKEIEQELAFEAEFLDGNEDLDQTSIADTYVSARVCVWIHVCGCVLVKVDVGLL